jgi:Putative abortive phage resistance protein AbiGi, antitoxin
MSQPDFLQEALTTGLMLTDHEVSFAPTRDPQEFGALIERVMPLLTARLAGLGKPLEALDEPRKQILFSGLGSMRGKIPMLCLSEIPPGKSLDHHRFSFGGFALVVKSEWLSRHGAERVMYVGLNSPASRQLYHCMATMHLLGLHVSPTGDVLFDNVTTNAMLELLPYVEVRDHLEEAEWRVVGRAGFVGGVRDTNKKLPLTLKDIEYIFVPSDAVAKFTAQVEALATKQGCSLKPLVLQFPRCIPTAI